MTTTSQFQKYPEYFGSREECEKYLRSREQTNPRYRGFTQAIFTAGDEQQFQQFRDDTNNQVCIPQINLFHNIYKDYSLLNPWKGYENIPSTSVINTFRYMLHKFKKGIFVKIKDNKVKVFLPFSKYNYINEWGDRIEFHPKFKGKRGTKRIDPKTECMLNFLERVYDMENRTFNENRVNKFTNSWYGNNCLLRYEYPLSENDSGVSQMSDMLKTLCEQRDIPDIEFFVNRRDFPLLKRDYTEPYDNIFDSASHPLVSHRYEKYSPILGGAVSSKYADVPIPTWEDWSRIGEAEGKYFTKCSGDYTIPNIPWGDKVPTAVFRGGSTGCGVTIQTNPRLKAAFLSSTSPMDEDKIPLLDAGITNWNLRPRKIQGQRYLTTIEIDKLPFGLVKYLTQEEQAMYKYRLCLDGHVTAFRLSCDLGSGSVVILPDSEWSIWFMKFLKPYEHYIPVKKDLSDLIEKIRWCKENDLECLKITQNAKRFYDTYLSKKGVLDYIQKTLIELKEKMGSYLYNYTTPLEIQTKKEKKYLDTFREILPFPNRVVTPSHFLSTYSIPSNLYRCHALLKGIEWVYNSVDIEYSGSREVVFKSDTTQSLIEKTTFVNFPVILKNIRDRSQSKQIESYHEVFVGKTCMNELLKEIPNFVYTIGEHQQENNFQIVTEHIEGISFLEYLQNKSFNLEEYLFILSQICLALMVAQRKFGFVHWDLMPWNIILQFHPKPVEHYYVISNEMVYRVRTNVIPVIIDYGKSHVIYNNEHYGLINLYKTSTIQDIVSILVTSISVILSHHHLKDTRSILILSNFLGNSGYAPNTIKTIHQLNSFLHTAKKFSNLISTDKGRLEDKTPLDLFNYIQTKISSQSQISKVSFIAPTREGGNSRQVFDYILSGSPQERVDSYTNVFKRFIDSTNKPKPKSLLLSYYVAQTFLIQMQLVWKQLSEFLSLQNKLDEIVKYKPLYTQCISIIEKRHLQELNTFQWKKIKIKLSSNLKLESSKYNEETFLLPSRILQIVKEEYNKVEDIIECRNVAISVLLHRGPYEIPQIEREKFKKNFAEILELDPLPGMVKTANRTTLLYVARKLYTKNIQQLYKRVKETKETCHDIEGLVKLYLDILEECEKKYKK